MATQEWTTACARIRRVGARAYEVSSQTHDGDYHTYDLTTHSCTCKAGQEGRFCWHWGAAKEADEFYACWRVGHGRDPQGCSFDCGVMVPGGLDAVAELYQELFR